MRSKSLLKTTILCGVFLTIFAVACATTVAQETSSQSSKKSVDVTSQETAAEVDEDEKLDDSFRKFGSAAGAAYQCTSGAEREKLVSDARQAYTRISQLFGTDRAFYFAVHFGGASQGNFDKAKCPELIKKLRESVLIRRAAAQ